MGTPSAMLPNCLPLSFPFVHRTTLIGASCPYVSQGLATPTPPTRLLSALSRSHLGPVHVGVRSQTRPHHIRDGAWLVGCCHLFGDLQGSGHYPQSPEQGEWRSLLQTLSEH